jgi:hypothetical protein
MVSVEIAKISAASVVLSVSDESRRVGAADPVFNTTTVNVHDSFPALAHSDAKDKFSSMYVSNAEGLSP